MTADSTLAPVVNAAVIPAPALTATSMMAGRNQSSGLAASQPFKGPKFMRAIRAPVTAMIPAQTPPSVNAATMPE